METYENSVRFHLYLTSDVVERYGSGAGVRSVQRVFSDTIVLLTPPVPPLDDIDPYQYFGEAIAKHHSKTVETAQIPYTNGNRTTTVHCGHIKRAKAVTVAANDAKLGKAAPHIVAVCQVNIIVNDTRPLVVDLTNKSPELLDYTLWLMRD